MGGGAPGHPGMGLILDLSPRSNRPACGQPGQLLPASRTRPRVLACRNTSPKNTLKTNAV